jgi:hypothetical protein
MHDAWDVTENSEDNINPKVHAEAYLEKYADRR